jgi:hypothetical protein
MILFLFVCIHRFVNLLLDVPRSVQPRTNSEDLVLFGNSIYPCILFDIVPRSVKSSFTLNTDRNVI